MDFFGGAFDFLDNATSDVSSVFPSEVAGTSSDAAQLFTDGGATAAQAADLAFGTDAIAGSGPFTDASGNFIGASPQVNIADAQGGLGSSLGGGISKILSSATKTLGGSTRSAGGRGEQLNQYRLNGQNRDVQGYEADKNPSNTPGLKSEDPRQVYAFWRSYMKDFAYSGK